jgi:hypothetical protein
MQELHAISWLLRSNQVTGAPSFSPCRLLSLNSLYSLNSLFTVSYRPRPRSIARVPRRQMQRTKVPKSVRPVSSRWMPELWASPKPFGLGEQHSNNFWEVFRAVWENRDQLP